MKKIQHHNHCKHTTDKPGLWAALKQRLSQRLSDHIADCPRCRQRLAMVNRVEVALILLKTQPHPLDLLARANTRAVGVLNHSLRQRPQSEKLRHSIPDQHWVEKKRPLIERLFHVAACLFVVLMVRMGVTSSLADVQTRGKTALHNYYARNLDAQMVNEIMPDDSSQA